MLKYFNQQWDTVPLCMIDTETTGTQPGTDKTVEVGIVRFENGIEVARTGSFINPGRAIPEEATEIHGIRQEDVDDAPALADFFEMGQVKQLLEDCQYAAYNGEFDKYFVPPIGSWDWPWVDALVVVRRRDPYVKGKGRHKLATACERHKIVLASAHRAVDDALAAGNIFYKIGKEMFPQKYTMGRLLTWQRKYEAVEWGRFMQWRSNLPPLEVAPDYATNREDEDVTEKPGPDPKDLPAV